MVQLFKLNIKDRQMKENLVSCFTKMFIEQGFPSIEYAQEVFGLTNDETKSLNEFALENSLGKDDCISIESINSNIVKVQVLTHDGEKWVKSFIEVECNILDFPKMAIRAISHDISPLQFSQVIGEKLNSKGFINDLTRNKFNQMIELYDDFYDELTEGLKLDFFQFAEEKLAKGVASE